MREARILHAACLDGGGWLRASVREARRALAWERGVVWEGVEGVPPRLMRRLESENIGSIVVEEGRWRRGCGLTNAFVSRSVVDHY
jgi:hypothetical protein